AQGDYAGAIPAFDAALAQDNRAAQALAFRGRSKEQLGRDADARADYDAAIDADGSASNALAWRCWMQLRLRGDQALARSDAERATRADSHFVEGQTCLGAVDLKDSRWSDAKTAFDAALQVQPGNPIALFGRGVARRRGGDGEGSKDMYQ